MRILVVGHSVLPFGTFVGGAGLAGYYLVAGLAEILDWVQMSPWEFRFPVAADAPVASSCRTPTILSGASSLTDVRSAPSPATTS